MSPHKEPKILRNQHISMLLVIAALAGVCALLYLTDASARQPTTHRGKTAQQWHLRYLKEHRALAKHGTLVRSLQGQLRQARRAVVHRPSSLEAIRLAAITYGVPYQEMLNVALCETGGTLNSYAKNRSSTASGLMQFLTGTFAGTPYGREDIFSPYANALAAGWLWKRSGWSPWVCKP